MQMIVLTEQYGEHRKGQIVELNPTEAERARQHGAVAPLDDYQAQQRQRHEDLVAAIDATTERARELLAAVKREVAQRGHTVEAEDLARSLLRLGEALLQRVQHSRRDEHNLVTFTAPEPEPKPEPVAQPQPSTSRRAAK